MSDTHRISPTSPLGEVEHATLLSHDIGNMYCNEEYSNITLIVEGRHFHAHKDILAARCHYFRALLFGGLRESDPECRTIELKDTNAQAFETLLKYIYMGRVNLLDLREDILLDVMGLAHQYGFAELEGAISGYLRAILSIHNVCLIYDVATLYSLDSLKQTCYMYMDSNAEDVMASEGFLSLSESALREVISRDSFYASEVQIFKAVERWSEANPKADITEIVKAIRLPLMNYDELLKVVRPSNLLCPNAILDAIEEKYERKDADLNYRGVLIPDENVGTVKYKAKVMKGEMRTALLDGDSINYDLDRGFTRHSIEDDAEPEGIVIELGKPSILNTIRLLLWDRDNRSYSYYIEASVDEKDWVKVVDHRTYLCRSWQNLHFQPRVCKFIRIVGTFNSTNKVFHLVSFECCFTTKHFELDRDTGLIIPVENMATINNSAIVIEGVSRSRNALLNGDTKSYDWDSGYTCHQLGSGSIVVQLSQPYVVSSMRLLLWDCDARTYSYYVEVSTNQQNWCKVADKTKDQCRSWQTLHFEPRPVTFIRIVGTRNTANEVFHCVHFECPANPTDPPQSKHSDPDTGDALPSPTPPITLNFPPSTGQRN
ncbi:putative BTB/POZ domain-containing protein 9 [Apostichopus japonicus]|uniref:BTB/POZ domain-containing protein 9 n=1 Tax=Stichopus japonicus TaxID=307972 RepID=A0A2G8KVU8_STIJA|nr:putative BTB/POZ domain-containing protein 9 [Apostichopus japonicus]